MMNPFKDVNWNPTLAEKRKFGLSLIIGFPAIAIFFGIVTRLSTQAWKPFFLWLGLGGFAAGVFFWIVPQIARPFYVVWYFIACTIGIVVGNLTFSLIFYLILTPLGWMRRAFIQEAVTKTFDRSKSSYWQDAPNQVDAKRYYRQF